MTKQKLAIGIGLIVIMAWGLIFFGYRNDAKNSHTTPFASGVAEWDGELPRPDRAVRYHLKTTLNRGESTDRETITHRFQFDYRPPDQFRLEVTPRNTTSLVDTIQGDSILVKTDGTRYQINRSGELFLAGQLQNDSIKFLSRMPGGNSYLASALTGRNPFDTEPAVKKTSDHLKFSGKQRTVLFDSRGHLKYARGPSRWIEQREGSYHKVTYSETVSEVIENPNFPSDHFDVSLDVVKTARGETGTTFPNHSYRRMDGTALRLYDLEGPYLINRWATWCPPCIFEIPHLNQLQEEYEDKITVIGVTDEKAKTIRQFLENDRPIRYTVLRQPGPPPAPYHHFQSLPFTFLIDSSGTLLKVVRGARTHQQWVQLVEEHLLEDEAGSANGVSVGPIQK